MYILCEKSTQQRGNKKEQKERTQVGAPWTSHEVSHKRDLDLGGEGVKVYGDQYFVKRKKNQHGPLTCLNGIQNLDVTFTRKIR